MLQIMNIDCDEHKNCGHIASKTEKLQEFVQYIFTTKTCMNIL